jgi:tetratricopeptide (TPR) repeat protein
MKRGLSNLACVALLLGIAAPAQTASGHTTVRHHREVDDSDHAVEIAQAEDAMSKKDYASAEKTLLEVIGKDATGKDANNYRAWFDLAFVYNATNRDSQAIDAYRKSVAANPAIFESNLNLGIMLAHERDPGAEKFLRAATTLKPSAPGEEGHYRAWLMLGHVLETSNPQEAIQAFENAAGLQPKETEPLLSAGLLLESEKQYPQAAAEYEKAAAIDPKSTEALAGVVNAYSEAGQVPQAEGALRKFLSLDPSNATAHVQLGRVLAAQKKYDQAAAELEAGLKLRAGDAEAERQLAAIYLDQKKFAEAAPHVEAALKAAPSDAQLHHWMGQVLLAEKKFPEAQDELIAALKLKPDLGEAYGDLAFAASEGKNYPLTIKALDARAKFLPEMPITYFLRATAYDHLQDAKLAAENYHKFLDVAGGRYPDQEWQAKHRLIAIEPKK